MLSKILYGAALVGAILSAGALPAPARAAVSVRITVGPPAPIYEAIPPRPGSLYVWEPGYWHWSGYRYVWFHGAYVPRPYPSAHWVPERYVGRRGNWYAVPGHWVR